MGKDIVFAHSAKGLATPNPAFKRDTAKARRPLTLR